MISQNQNSFENLGTILLDLLTRRGKTITEELRDALAFFMLHLGQAEHLGGLCAELDATPQNKKYVELLREAELLTDSSNKIADEPNNLSVAPTPFLLDESEPKKLRIYSRRNFCSESRLAAGIHGMCSTSASDVNEVKEALAQLEQTLKNARENGDKKAYSLNPLQLEAAELAVSEKFSVICGGPGTGKTTTVVKFIEAFLEIHPKGIIQMCAPTGKATSRLLESVKNQADAGPSSAPYYPAVRKALAEDRLTSLTIHKLLVTDLSNGKRPSADNPIEADLLIVDESSMIDSALALKLIRSIDPTKTQTVFLGDKHQLAAVGPGSVFADISDNSGVLKGHIVELKESIRFNDKSAIGRLAQRMLAFEEGREAGISDFISEVEYTDDQPFEGFKDTGVFFKSAGRNLPLQAQKWLEEKLDSYCNAVENLNLTLTLNDKNEVDSRSANFENLPNDVQQALKDVWNELSTFRPLCAQREGPTGVNAVNDYCEDFVKTAFIVPSADDMYNGKVIIVRQNDSGLGVANGDVAVIFGLKTADSDKPMWYAFIGDLKKIVPAQLLPKYDTAFAITIHQSQGSGFRDVAIFLPTLSAGSDAASLCTRELLYPGITRSETTCQIFGAKDALDMSLKTVTQRSGGLPQRLKERFSEQG